MKTAKKRDGAELVHEDCLKLRRKVVDWVVTWKLDLLELGNGLVVEH